MSLLDKTPETTQPEAGTLTGRHVLGIFAGAFAIIIGVNLFMAFNAVSTFPGLETRNPYMASQVFDDRRAAQVALGWTVGAAVEGDRLTLTIEDETGPVAPQRLSVLVGRPTHREADQTPDLSWTGTGYSGVVEPLDHGVWLIKIEAIAADGTAFSQRLHLRVAG